ncbi:apolipoprotein d-like [Plakobranchus ocellatus]|uniref:Apolipoprotein D n=1 Tax=Plakobranchus ocellatus TaxID=259542 RepID=A0AAV4DNC1_9GAST|nr:apolipoprotein d-like [Plakobranchus ocellatus]
MLISISFIKFTFLQYLGVWYEYQRFPELVEGSLDCTSSTFSDAWNGMKVTDKGTRRTDLFGNKLVLRTTSIDGLATVPDEAKPAELNIVFRGASPTEEANYIVQDTDYTNYAVVFSCLQMRGFNIQYAYILTRVRGLVPPNLAQLESKLTAAGVDVSAFFVVNQKGCPGM